MRRRALSRGSLVKDECEKGTVVEKSAVVAQLPTNLEIGTPLTLSSLPKELLYEIVSYLGYSDRFRLKLAGNRLITEMLFSFSKPTLNDYLRELIPGSPSRFSTIEPIYKKYLRDVFCMACEEGYNALVLKLTNEDVAVLGALNSPPGTGVYLMYLKIGLRRAALRSHRSTIEILLRLVPKDSVLRDKQLKKNKLCMINETLNHAASTGDPEIVQMLLKAGAQIFSPTCRLSMALAAAGGHDKVVEILSKRTYKSKHSALAYALGWAAQSGHETTVRLLLDMGARNLLNSEIPSAIHLAALRGHESIFKLLLSKGARDFAVYCQRGEYPKISQKRYWSCLNFAVFSGNYDFVKFILDQGIKPTEFVTGKKLSSIAIKMPVLPIASECGWDNIVKLLLERGLLDSGESALYIALMSDNTAIITTLLNAGVNLEAYNPNEETPLHVAARHGAKSAVSLLLDRKVDIDAVCIHGRTPLHYAVIAGDASIVRLLLEAGALPDATNNTSIYAPSMDAIKGDYEDCLALLLEYRGDPELSSTILANELHYAISLKRAKMIPLLIQHGANIERIDQEGYRPLHRAAAIGSNDMVEQLILAGADPNAKDSSERTALHHAAKASSSDVMSQLLQHGAYIDAVDIDGQSALHIAATSSSLDGYYLLLGKMADTTIRDILGKTASDYRIRYNSPEIYTRPS